MKKDVRNKSWCLLIILIVQLGVSQACLANKSTEVESCWAADAEEFKLISAAKRGLENKIKNVDYWPRMPVDTSFYRPFVECVKVQFEKVNGKFEFEVLNSTRETLVPSALNKLRILNDHNFSLSEGIVIFYYFNPVVESHWIPFNELGEENKPDSHRKENKI